MRNNLLATAKMVNRSEGLSRASVMCALGITGMTYRYPNNRYKDKFINEASIGTGYNTDICPTEIAVQALNVDRAYAARLLNVMFNLEVEDDIKPSECERMAAEKAEAIRLKNEAFFSENIGLLDWAHACLNEKKPSSAMQDTWAYKALEVTGINIDVLREKLEKRKWVEDEYERKRIADGMFVFKNIRAALEAAQ